MKGWIKIAAFSLAIGANPSHALKMDFTDQHRGMTLGTGTYFKWLPNDNAFDPLPHLTTSGTTVSGSDQTRLLPLRLGVFRSGPTFGASTYLRYMTNLQGTWTTTGTLEGSGTTRFGSVGIGADASYYFWSLKRIRSGLNLNGEYILQKANLSFTPTGGTLETFQVKATSYLLGLAFQNEIYLGDQWTFSLLTGYQYGYSSQFTAPVAGGFLGATHSAGALTSQSTGGTIPAQFGGFHLEIVLKLSFM